jgi:nucleoside-diphosphate-sugar epimerase
MRALVTGATGFVGHQLLAHLEHPVVLSRDGAKAERELAQFGVKAFSWNPTTEPAPAEAFAGIDTVFHLAGVRRLRLVDQRQKSTHARKPHRRNAESRGNTGGTSR